MIGASKTRLRQKFVKIESDDVTRESEYWFTRLELLRGDLQKLGVIICDVALITRVLSNLSE